MRKSYRHEQSEYLRQQPYQPDPQGMFRYGPLRSSFRQHAIWPHHRRRTRSAWLPLRRCRPSLSPNFRLFLGHLVEYRVKQFIQFIRFDTFQCCLLVNHTLMQQVDCDFNHCSTGTFSVTGLQEHSFPSCTVNSISCIS